MTYLDAVLRFFDSEGYSNRENIAIIISDIFEKTPDIALADFKNHIRSIKSDFFRINRLKRSEFSERVFQTLLRQKEIEKYKESGYEIALKFIKKYFEVGYKKTEHKQERNDLIELFSTIPKPHEKVMKALNELLEKIFVSYSLNLHGVKEYSGIDIAKEINGTVVGFQIKTRSDDISENMILSEVTRAQKYGVNGFVLIYARVSNKKVESSILGAYHIFKLLKGEKKIYPAIVDSKLLAELFVKYSISLPSD